MLRSLLAWSLGIPNTVLWGLLSLLGSPFDRAGRWSHACMARWARLDLALIGVRLEVAGLEHVDRSGPQVFASNHQSFADILVLAAALPVRFGFVAKSELFRIPFLGWHMRRSGFIAIDRSNPVRSAKSLLVAAERVRGGLNAVVFPEGTRSPDGALLPFRGGGFRLALRAGVPVVPIAIRGTMDVVRKGEIRVRPAAVQLQVLPPVGAAAFGEDRDALAAEVRRAIAGALGAESPG